MTLSLHTLINMRRAILALLSAVDAMLLEGYGWVPKHKTAALDSADTIQSMDRERSGVDRTLA